MKVSKDAQAVIYMASQTQGVVFLVLKRRSLSTAQVRYRLVKGGVELNETPKETILREIGEETGLKNVRLIKKIWEYSYKTEEVEHQVEVFLVEARETEEMKPSSTKEGNYRIEQLLWLNYNKAREVLSFQEEKECLKKAIQYVSKYINRKNCPSTG